MEEKDIKKMAKELNVPLWLVKESLGLPLTDYSSESLTNLKLIVRGSDANSEEEYCALSEIRKRILGRLTTAIRDEVRDWYVLVKELDIEDLVIKVLQRWNELSLFEVEQAQSFIEAKTACDRAPRHSEARRLAQEKKSQFALQKIKNADNDWLTYVQAAKMAPKDSEAKKEIIRQAFQVWLAAQKT